VSDDFPEETFDDHGHNLEQMEANVNEVGRLCSRYFANLQDSGFTRKEAFQLTQDWHLSFWHSAHIPPDEIYDMFEDDEHGDENAGD
jgi:hypothetical protein